MDILDHHLRVEPSYADLVINVGKITVGEKNRKQLTDSQRKQEREKIAVAACSLLNSGGGVICMEMANRGDAWENMEMGQDLEDSLRDFIDPFHFHTYFATLSQGKYYFIFVKSWSNGVSSEKNSTIPRVCSQSVLLWERRGTSTMKMTPRAIVNFLKNKKRERDVSSEESPPSKKVLKAVNPKIEKGDPVALVFQKDRLERGEVLPFSESMSVEFKNFSSKKVVDYVKDIIPKYISAFANIAGGYLFIGVEDGSRKVVGGSKENVKPSLLENVIKEKIDNLPVFHFRRHRYPINYMIKFLEVYEKGELYGYVCVVRVKPFCCVVFTERPISWIVKDGHINRLSFEEWMDMMLDADRVPSDEINYNPDSLCQELFSEYEGLEELMNKQMREEECSQGILIFSRSWAVDIGLQENQKVLCDALLIAPNSLPVLYTVLREPPPADGEEYSIRTARTLKQKLVNTGGYTGRVCIIPKVLILNPRNDTDIPRSSCQTILYPSSYQVTDKEMTKLLQSLVIVLLSFRSFLSDRLGYEVLNLLTIEQYNVVSKNLHNTPRLFVHGFPGTGKTVIAMKIIEKIKNVFSCEKEEILYICENQPLRDFMKKKAICQAVTRKYFQSYSFEEIKHIIIDEAQNFRQEDGPWYEKAKAITQKKGVSPGTLWIFLDYYQTSHTDCSGLPNFSKQYPQEQLTRVVRNADPIAKYIRENMEKFKTNPPFDIHPTSLELLAKACWSSGVQGFCVVRENLTRYQIVTCVAEECKKLFRVGYSSKNIAILVSRRKDIEYYESPLKQATKKIRGLRISSDPNEEGNCVVLDSIRRFSGLERNIVFGLNPVAICPDISCSFLVCLASRALTHLYIYMERAELGGVAEQEIQTELSSPVFHHKQEHTNSKLE
ncbi:schlafen family member 11 isoform X2 [Notamacropus eugenii]|uniref:schlafen family member 11 isoform X2 n=1 Tax=Notamacropus eugenii TaxID=9315 RepID=UPI003B678CA6